MEPILVLLGIEVASIIGLISGIALSNYITNKKEN